MQKLTVGLIGNPNSGKTTLFNQLTGARQRVGNWAGVTVERKEGIFATTDHQVTLVDLPGTYSLTTISSQTSLDEQIACHYILSGDADMLINVVDASNLERNLYLTLQLLELGIPCVVALNMLDIAEKQQVRIDIDAGWVCSCWRAISTAGPMPATPPINWISPWRISATRSTTRRCTSLTRAIRPSPPFATPSAIP